jgi:hypothetical protein
MKYYLFIVLITYILTRNLKSKRTGTDEFLIIQVRVERHQFNLQAESEKQAKEFTYSDSVFAMDSQQTQNYKLSFYLSFDSSKGKSNVLAVDKQNEMEMNRIPGLKVPDKGCASIYQLTNMICNRTVRECIQRDSLYQGDLKFYELIRGVIRDSVPDVRLKSASKADEPQLLENYSKIRRTSIVQIMNELLASPGANLNFEKIYDLLGLLLTEDVRAEAKQTHLGHQGVRKGQLDSALAANVNLEQQDNDLIKQEQKLFHYTNDLVKILYKGIDDLKKICKGLLETDASRKATLNKEFQRKLSMNVASVNDILKTINDYVEKEISDRNGPLKERLIGISTLDMKMSGCNDLKTTLSAKFEQLMRSIFINFEEAKLKKESPALQRYLVNFIEYYYLKRLSMFDSSYLNENKFYEILRLSMAEYLGQKSLVTSKSKPRYLLTEIKDFMDSAITDKFIENQKLELGEDDENYFLLFSDADFSKEILNKILIDKVKEIKMLYESNTNTYKEVVDGEGRQPQSFLSSGVQGEDVTTRKENK